LEDKEKRLINSSLNLGKAAMAAGMLFGVLGQQIGGVGGQMLTFASYGMYAVSMMAYAKGAIIFLNLELEKHAIFLGTTTMQWIELGVAISAAIGAFLIVMEITQRFGRAAGLVTGLALAVIGLALSFSFLKAVLTSGASVALDTVSAIGIGALAGGLIGMAYAGTHQMGTRMAEVTGPAIIHHGEVIYNPATNRPTQVGNDLGRASGSSETYIDASMHVETLNTKTDKEELDEMLRKRNRTIAQNNR
jgi:hypothetical protein